MPSTIKFALFSSEGYLGQVAAVPSATGIGAFIDGEFIGHTPNLKHVYATLPYKWKKAFKRGPNHFWCQSRNGATTRVNVATSDCAPSAHFDAQTVDLHVARNGKRLTRLTAVPFVQTLEEQ